ncbi:MAG: FAD-dependent oxidoreductase, partial [Bdellovibrionales bacterium]|nr:FAD-dependent oxidoreductase [Bdellovibrionales bacterium]
SYVHVKKAFFSPTTAILDVSAALKGLERVLYNKDIPILFQDEVVEINKEKDGFILKTTHEEIFTSKLVNAGGLLAVSNRKKLGLNDLEDEWVKGSYLKINRNYYTDHLIYPVPEKNLKGLGVHTSFDLQHQVRFGPNTENVEVIDYSLSEKIIEDIVPSVIKTFKGLERKDFALDYSGIRSKIKYKNQIFSDFWIKGPTCEMSHGVLNYIELCGIDSPGLTSAPAIAKYVLEMIAEM